MALDTAELVKMQTNLRELFYAFRDETNRRLLALEMGAARPKKINYLDKKIKIDTIIHSLFEFRKTLK